MCAYFWILWKERGKHSTNRVTESRRKVVQYQLGVFADRVCQIVTELFARANRRQSEVGRRTVGQVNQQQSARRFEVFVDDNDVGEVLTNIELLTTKRTTKHRDFTRSKCHYIIYVYIVTRFSANLNMSRS